MAKAKNKPVFSGEKTAQRDAKGRFLPGVGPGPGRPKSQHSMAIKAAREAALSVGLPTLIQAASAGDVESAKTLCLLGIPRLKPIALLEPVDLSKAETVAEKADCILAAIAGGEISGETATVLLDLLRTLDSFDVRKRLEELEQRAQSGHYGVLVTPGLLTAEAWIVEARRTVNDEPQE